MKVIHLSVECFPVAKVGGLADVVGALPKYQRKIGLDSCVVMPYYDKPFVKQHDFDVISTGSIIQGKEILSYQILKERHQILGFELFLIKIPGMLDRSEVYMYANEAEQWMAFQHAFLDYLKQQQIVPDIMHCHDHHVGLIPFLIQYAPEYAFLQHCKTVFTVHNAQYQGWIHWDKSTLLPAFDEWKWGLLDWNGMINPMAAAIKCCTAYTTVSHGYLEELFVEANGLESLFLHEKAKSSGIINGIDTDIWDPETDSSIFKTYTAESIGIGKLANKKKLCHTYQLNPDYPLIAFIGRFALEKGADLLPDIIDEFLNKTDENLSIFILGSGDKEIQSQLVALGNQTGKNLGLFIGYDEQLAHLIYASADFLVMPSRVEPCGLNQMYAMKYGTIPVVHATGGLKDTVKDLSESDGYGFTFESLKEEDLYEAIQRAIVFYDQKRKFNADRKKLMSLDFSWEKSTEHYVKLYNQLLN